MLQILLIASCVYYTLATANTTIGVSTRTGRANGQSGWGTREALGPVLHPQTVTSGSPTNLAVGQQQNASRAQAINQPISSNTRRKTSGKFLEECKETRVRREVRDLSPSELKLVLNGIRDLLAGDIDDMVAMHGKSGYWDQAHGTPMFLPWHRLFIREFEDRLRAKVGQDISLPYWDWTLDSQRPHTSVIFSANYFGKSEKSMDYMVVDSVFSHKNLILNHPRPHSLKRAFDTIGALETFAQIDTQLDTSVKSKYPFSTMSMYVENGPHARIHTRVGGYKTDIIENRGDMTKGSSPNDPLFWLHHAFIDKIWLRWQSKSANQLKFDGKMYSTNVDPNSIIPRYNVPVSSVLNPEAQLCVRYETPGAKARSLRTDTEEDMKHLQKPEAVDEDWLRQNNINPDQIEKLKDVEEKAFKNITDKVSRGVDIFFNFPGLPPTDNMNAKRKSSENSSVSVASNMLNFAYTVLFALIFLY